MTATSVSGTISNHQKMRGSAEQAGDEDRQHADVGGQQRHAAASAATARARIARAERGRIGARAPSCARTACASRSRLPATRVVQPDQEHCRSATGGAVSAIALERGGGSARARPRTGSTGPRGGAGGDREHPASGGADRPGERDVEQREDAVVAQPVERRGRAALAVPVARAIMPSSPSATSQPTDSSRPSSAKRGPSHCA